MIARSTSVLFLWLGLTIAASLMLYHTSDRVHALDQQLKTLNAQIDAEQQSLHILKAEWVYLANPARIEAEAHRHLALLPTAPRRVAALQDIASLLPAHDGNEPVFAAKDLAPDTKALLAVQMADAAPSTTTKAQPNTSVIPVKRKTNHVFATLNEGRINDHMIMEHASIQQASTDSIGTLIASLSLRP